MTDWIKVVTGAVMVVPLAVFMVLVAWNDAKEDEVSFFEFAKMALGLAGGFLLFFGLAILAGHGGAMIYEAFR